MHINGEAQPFFVFSHPLPLLDLMKAMVRQLSLARKPNGCAYFRSSVLAPNLLKIKYYLSKSLPR